MANESLDRREAAPRNVESAKSAKKSPERSREISEAREGADSAVYETVISPEAANEAAAETMGNVSEILSEQKENKGAGTGAKAKKDDNADPALIKEQLLKNLPTRAKMNHQIEKEIKKEIRYLRKRAMKMMASPGEANYFEMNNLMKKIRDLKGILKGLVKASLDHIKTLWLRFVHGIM